MRRQFNSFISEFPQGQPDVIVNFTGLLTLNFRQNGVCKVGVHPDKNHFLQMKIELRKQGEQSPITTWEHGFLQGLSGKLSLEVDRPVSSGITQFRLPLPLDRKAKPDQQNDPQGLRARDYRWVVHPDWLHRN